MARLAAVNRSQVNRWSRGENRPGYDPVRRLAAAIYRQHPGIARELVEASGYAWAEPEQVPPEPAVPDDVRQVIMKAPRDDQWKRDAIEALEAIARGTTEEEGSSPSRPGPERRAG